CLRGARPLARLSETRCRRALRISAAPDAIPRAVSEVRLPRARASGERRADALPRLSLLQPDLLRKRPRLSAGGDHAPRRTRRECRGDEVPLPRRRRLHVRAHLAVKKQGRNSLGALALT